MASRRRQVFVGAAESKRLTVAPDTLQQFDKLVLRIIPVSVVSEYVRGMVLNLADDHGADQRKRVGGPKRARSLGYEMFLTRADHVPAKRNSL